MKNKMKNKLIKFFFISILSFIIAYILGYVIGYTLGSLGLNLENSINQTISFFRSIPILIRNYSLYILALLIFIEIFSSELFMNKMHKLGDEIINGISDDSEADKKELKLSRYGALSISIVSVISILSLFIYSIYFTNISFKSINLNFSFILSTLIVIVSVVYDSIYSIRFINFIIKLYPEKYGDPTSLKFADQWIESCDEAEKIIIYKSTFKSYNFLQKLLMFTLVILIFSHILVNTGLLPIFICGIFIIISNITYQIEVFKLSKKGKIE